MNRPRWDIFCRVVDNFGDIGVCWRIAQQLANEYSASIRLWVDDLATFSCLCPSIVADAATQQLGSIEIRRWECDFPAVDIPDVVIEAFACELPETYVMGMAQRAIPPIWINLEYLSAETWVDDCHLLASPHPRLPLTKYFFFPGFTPRTGGLLREQDLPSQRLAFDATAESVFWTEIGVPPVRGTEVRVSLFCYDNPALPELLQQWQAGPDLTRVLATAGSATEQISEWVGRALRPGDVFHRQALTVSPLPFLSPAKYDRLLWASDVNFVRGEDSFVRAQWARRPFVWQIYPQSEGAHLVKLNAFLLRYLDGFPGAEAIRQIWNGWNQSGEAPLNWSDFLANRRSIEQHAKDWATHLDQTADLANNLVCFVRGR